MPARPCIAILTDFGLADAYVGVMKGVIAGICPDANIIDLNHSVPPQDVRDGAWQLLGAYKFFPAGTVFLCVVDPHVGTKRLALGIAAGEYTFIGPDNGLMSWAVTAAAGTTAPTAHELANLAYQLTDRSATFHGRDLFAPAAAHVAMGIALESFGPPVDAWTQLDLPEPHASRHGVLVGEVIHVDGFGNLVTNLSRATVEELQARAPEKQIVVQFRGAHIERIGATYGETRTGATVALFGSTGYLELAINGGSAHQRFNAGVGEPVTVYQQ